MLSLSQFAPQFATFPADFLAVVAQQLQTSALESKKENTKVSVPIDDTNRIKAEK